MNENEKQDKCLCERNGSVGVKCFDDKEYYIALSVLS